MALNTGGVSSVALSFVLDARLQDVASFTIYVDGTAYTAAVSADNNWSVTGRINVPVPSDLHEFATYAIAVTSYGGSGEGVVEDSRNPPEGTPNYNGRNGMGHETHFITSNIKLKGLRWESRPCDVYNHIDQTVYPNASAPYHAVFTNGPSAGNATQGVTRPAVYLKGQAPSLKITVEPLGGTVPVRARVRDMNLSVTTPGYTFGTYSSPLAANETTIVCPPLKNEVNALWASLRNNFQCQFQDGTWADIYIRQDDVVSSLRLFAVYSQPGAPMVPAPWIGVLENSCQWAAGEQTLPNVAKKLTQGVYFSQRFAYPNGTQATWLDEDDSTGQTFLLTDFLNNGGYQSGNCWDVSNYLAICANSQGLGFQSAVYGAKDAGGTAVDFTTNPVALIGSSPGQPINDWQFSPSTWAWHQVCLSGGVFDSCAAHKYDLGGAEYRNPPIAWPEPGYWQTPTPTGWPYPYWRKLGLIDTPGPATAVLNPYNNGLPTAPYTPEVS